MRWILPLLSFALAPLAFADIAVYIGNTTTQASGGSDSSIKSSRSIQVIDLATGKYRAVVFNSAVRNNSFTVSDEAQYTIAKTADRRLQTSTSFAEAGTGAGADQSTQVSSTLLQGRDSGVFLRAGVKTQWPRLIAGAGFDLATAGVGAADQPTPALVSKSFFTLTLDAVESQNANAGTDPLDTIANRVAHSLVQAATTPHGPVSSGGQINLGSLGVIKIGTGTITFTPGQISGGATLSSGSGALLNGLGANPLFGGILQVVPNTYLTNIAGGLLNVISDPGGTIDSGTLLLNGSNTYNGSTTINGGSLTLGGSTTLLGNPTLTVGSGSILTGTTTLSGGTLQFSAGPGLPSIQPGTVIHLSPNVTTTILGHEYSGGPTGATLTLPPGTTTVSGDTTLIVTPNP